jgi:hypothetical protein
MMPPLPVMADYQKKSKKDLVNVDSSDESELDVITNGVLNLKTQLPPVIYPLWKDSFTIETDMENIDMALVMVKTAILIGKKSISIVTPTETYTMNVKKDI